MQHWGRMTRAEVAGKRETVDTTRVPTFPGNLFSVAQQTPHADNLASDLQETQEFLLPSIRSWKTDLLTDQKVTALKPFLLSSSLFSVSEGAGGRPKLGRRPTTTRLCTFSNNKYKKKKKTRVAFFFPWCCKLVFSDKRLISDWMR